MNNPSNTFGPYYFEDFDLGATYRHARGKTVKESDAVTICNLVLNTAEGHFNDHKMASLPIGQSVVFGGVTISMIIGLASQDTAGNAIRELGMNNIKLLSPVKHGDTLYAFSKVLEKELTEEGGMITFTHYGINQNQTLVFQGNRSVLLKTKASS